MSSLLSVRCSFRFTKTASKEKRRGRKDIQHDFYYFDSVFMAVVCEIVGS